MHPPPQRRVGFFSGLLEAPSDFQSWMPDFPHPPAGSLWLHSLYAFYLPVSSEIIRIIAAAARKTIRVSSLCTLHKKHLFVPDLLQRSVLFVTLRSLSSLASWYIYHRCGGCMSSLLLPSSVSLPFFSLPPPLSLDTDSERDLISM